MKQPSVMTHSFSNAPSADIPRSSFDRSHGLKTTFDAGKLVPVFLDEALPGDTLSLNPTMFARINTPIYPIMDNLFLDIHFFSVPYRQVWSNFRKFCGEQVDPGDSTDYTIPTVTVNTGTGYSTGSLYDYLGLPTLVDDFTHSVLPLRAYKHIYNEWYRDQNLVGTDDFDLGDTESNSFYLRERGKRHDYFTSCLPWLQKGDAIELPLGQDAPIYGIGSANQTYVSGPVSAYETGGTASTSYANYKTVADHTSANALHYIEEDPDNSGYPGIYADLSNATAATINDLRRSFQIQKLLERDARSGTRYAEIMKSHFGVNFMDVTYRPEFLGGTSSPVRFNSVPSTADPSTGTRNVGDLGAFGQVLVQGGGFTKSFTEHCIVMGIASVRADLTYQQGLDRMWSRSTRYDMYWPALAHIGEQSVLNQEIYCQGAAGGTDDTDIFGYQERWAEYRYKQSKLTGLMRSNATGSLDAWHLSQEFGSLPALNSVFIKEDPPLDRVVAVTTEPDFTMDAYFKYHCARPMPLYSVPGLIDHF